jgi:DNA-binding MarR family transcriptional regulator
MVPVSGTFPTLSVRSATASVALSIRRGAFHPVPDVDSSGLPWSPRLVELAGAVDVTPPTATRMCDRLVEKTMNVCRHDRGDRRLIRLTLARKGYDLVDAVTTRRRGEIGELSQAIPADQQEALVDSFQSYFRSRLGGKTAAICIRTADGRLITGVDERPKMVKLRPANRCKTRARLQVSILPGWRACGASAPPQHRLNC